MVLGVCTVQLPTVGCEQHVMRDTIESYLCIDVRSFVVQTVQAEPVADTSESARVVKKYPNRRLYDTHTSTYITLTDIKELVMRGEPFVVRDAKTNEDLTRSILLQIILEEETAGVPLFSEQMLANLIRFYGHSMQGFMGSYLEKNLQIFMDLQQKMAAQTSLKPELWQPFMGVPAPMQPSLMSGYLEQSQSALAQMQEQMLSTFGLKRSPTSGPTT